MRIEDGPLLCGAGAFVADLGTRAGTGEMAILRATVAHARIVSLDTSRARSLSGVYAVLTASDVRRWSAPLAVGLKVEVECWPIAVDRVRYVGEPVAVVVASDRYVAEDALDLIEVEYAELEPVVTIAHGLDPSKPAIHERLGTNLCNDRRFSYGEPEAAFAEAHRVVTVEVEYPRNSCTPMETYGLIAHYDPHGQSYDVLANFQGPFSIHSVIARALQVPGNRLRLRTPPDSGGSYGTKQGIFPYIVLAGIAARVSHRPVRWIEDRLEHLSASVSATGRKTIVRAAVNEHAKVLALDWDQVEDVGAYIRAPEPATLYRMHGNMTGAYHIPNVRIRNRIVMTNKTPTGLNRGFGGPQVYFALERLMHETARALEMEPLEVIKKNLISSGAMPYRTACGAWYDSGDYAGAVAQAVVQGGLDALRQRRDEARAAGRHYGIGYAACVEPSVSNMGYITTVLEPEQRAKAGPKNGAQTTATVAVDPLGGVSVHAACVPQGQGHRTVLAQVVAEVLGIDADRVAANTELDTAKDSWSIASGNYSSRFAAAVCGAAHLAASKLKAKLEVVAASQLNVRTEDLSITEGDFHARDNPDNRLSFARVAAAAHWAPGTVPDNAMALRETVFWTPPELAAPDDQDRVNSSLCHGFIFDFCGVEVDEETGGVTIDKYVTMHDCGRVLHPGMVAGQITGGFAHAVGAAIYEELAYGEDGSFLSGTFADYPVPTAMEIPEPLILHMETPSPVTALGAKGVGEGNCMSTPVCLANAVADALQCAQVQLPLAPKQLIELVGRPEPAPPEGMIGVEVEVPPTMGRGARSLTGRGRCLVSSSPEVIWASLFDCQVLSRVIPGCREVRQTSATTFEAKVSFGVGPVRGEYRASIELADLDEPHRLKLIGHTQGALGSAQGTGSLALRPTAPGATELCYEYEARVGGKVAAVGGRLLDGAAKVVIGQFFSALAKEEEPADVPRGDWRGWLRRWLGGGR